MNQDFSQFFQEHFYTIILVQIILSLIFALIVFFVGVRRGKRNLGLTGSIVTFFVGIFAPVLALISAVIFVSVIFIKTGKDRDVNRSDSE